MVKFSLFTLSAIGLVPFVASSVTDRSCGNDTNNFWLDIVLVIDNSEKMINTNVYETISSIFGPKARIGTGYNDPRSTRVGIITYNYNATMVANLRKLKSLDQLQTQLTTLKNAGNEIFKNSDMTNLDTGLFDAQEIFNTTYDRENYKKVVMIFTSGYDFAMTRPDQIARALRSQFVSIITINTGKDKTVEKQLETLASDKMHFKMSENITAELQNALATVNCYCPEAWPQYKHFGVCMFFPNVMKNRAAAHKSCQSLSIPSSLPTEFNKKKRDFNYELINSYRSKPLTSYYNGLTSINGTWYWDQPQGKPLIPLDPSSGTLSSTSGCIADVVYSDESISWTPVNCATSFYFLCEASSCDTDNYCD